MNEKEFSKELSQKAGMEEIILRRGNGEKCFSTGPFYPRKILNMEELLQKEYREEAIRRLGIRGLLLEYQLLVNGAVYEITRLQYQENGDKKVLARVYLIVFSDKHGAAAPGNAAGSVVSSLFVTNNKKILESIRENFPGKNPGDRFTTTFPPIGEEGECPDYLLQLKPANWCSQVQPPVNVYLTFRTRHDKILSTGVLVHCDLNQYDAIDRIFRKDSILYDFDDDWFELEEDAHKVRFSIQEALLDLRLWRVQDPYKEEKCINILSGKKDGVEEIVQDPKKNTPKRFELDARTAIEDTGVKIEYPMFSAVINKILQKLPELQIMKVSVRGYPNFYVARETITSQVLKMRKDVLWLASSTALFREPDDNITFDATLQSFGVTNRNGRTYEANNTSILPNISGMPAGRRSWIYRFIREYGDSKMATYTANTTIDKHDEIVPDPDSTVYHDWWDKTAAPGIPGIPGCSAILALEELYKALVGLSEEKNREYVKFISRIGK